MPTSPFAVTEIAAAFGGRYEGLHELRVGGQGVVYRATRIRTAAGLESNDDVALKLHTDPREDARAEREILAMEGNRHPNLANLIEHGIQHVSGQPVRFAAWTFIEGEPLDSILSVQGPVSPRVIAAIGRDVSGAVDHLWTRDRIVHRDINPKNVMLRAGHREAVLIDLGAAKHLNQPAITGPQLTWGTWGYLSPEQYRADPNLTPASDVFALGVTLQEALLARHPTARDQDALLRPLARTGTLAPTAPASLAALLDRMLSPRAAFRPSLAELRDEFTRLAGIL